MVFSMSTMTWLPNRLPREHLQSRGIKSLPVTIIDDDQVIIGYYPKKLVPALKLETRVDLSSSTSWLADKYDRILRAAIRATCQLSQEQLDQQVPWRPQSLGSLILHIVSFPELAWLSHKHGSMSTEDMRASTERLKDVNTPDALAEYGDGVRRDIIEFLGSGNTAAFERVVPAHYGGEVTVLGVVEYNPAPQHPPPEADLLVYGERPGHDPARGRHR